MSPGRQAAETSQSHQFGPFCFAALNYILLHQVVWNLHWMHTEDFLPAMRKSLRQKGRCLQLQKHSSSGLFHFDFAMSHPSHSSQRNHCAQMNIRHVLDDV